MLQNTECKALWIEGTTALSTLNMFWLIIHDWMSVGLLDCWNLMESDGIWWFCPSGNGMPWPQPWPDSRCDIRQVDLGKLRTCAEARAGCGDAWDARGPAWDGIHSKTYLKHTKTCKSPKCSEFLLTCPSFPFHSFDFLFSWIRQYFFWRRIFAWPTSSGRNGRSC